MVDAIRRSTAVAPHLAESPYPRPGRDALAPAREDAGRKYSDQIRQWSRRLAVCGIHSNCSIKKLTSLEHRVHGDRQSARNGDGGPFEIQPFP